MHAKPKSVCALIEGKAHRNDCPVGRVKSKDSSAREVPRLFQTFSAFNARLGDGSVPSFMTSCTGFADETMCVHLLPASRRFEYSIAGLVVACQHLLQGWRMAALRLSPMLEHAREDSKDHELCECIASLDIGTFQHSFDPNDGYDLSYG